ncbi:MAG: hypothetical protein LBN08_06970 [Lactobacillales bacterium]|nr:hypothetical protein [Lactobacillales bacterium]
MDVYEIDRIQFAVGQGGFHSGILKNQVRECKFVYVYDCGKSGNKGPLKREIAEFNSIVGDSDIDEFFISHLDEDHVDGLKEITKNRKIVNLVIPAYGDEIEAVILLAKSNKRSIEKLKNDYKISVQFIKWLAEQKISDNIERIILLVSADDEYPDVQQQLDSKVDVVVAKDYEYERKGRFSAFWKLIPYINPRTLNKIQRKNISEFIKQQGIKNFSDCDEIATWIADKNNRAALKRELKKQGVKINEASLSLYSGDSNGKNGWLLTGDINLSANYRYNDFYGFYSKIISKAEIISTPHHGSSKNHKDNLYSDFKPTFIISEAGICNGYGHPNAIMKNNIKHHIVTECPSSRVRKKIIIAEAR